MVDTDRPEVLVFPGGRRADDRRPDVFGDLHGRDTDTSTSAVDQGRLSRHQSAHRDDQLPRGQIGDRQRCTRARVHAIGSLEHLVRRHADRTRVPAELAHRQHILANPRRVHPIADRVDGSRHLIPDDDRDPRQVRVGSHSRHDVGEVDPGRLDCDANLAGRRLWIGSFTHLEDFGSSGLADPDLTHAREDNGMRSLLRNGVSSRRPASRAPAEGDAFIQTWAASFEPRARSASLFRDHDAERLEELRLRIDKHVVCSTGDRNVPCAERFAKQGPILVADDPVLLSVDAPDSIGMPPD